MKIFLLMAILFFACNSTSKIEGRQYPIDEEKEKAAMLKVIESETENFFKRDYQAWKDNFIHKDYAFQAWNNGNGTIDVKVGWAEVNEKLGAYIKNHPLPPGSTSHPKVERKNMIVQRPHFHIPLEYRRKN